MPAPPEVLQVARRVRRVEVLGEAEAEQQREPDGDVGVATEVAVDLHRVAPGGEDRLGCRVLGRRREDRRHDRARHVRRDDHLLEQPGQDQPEGAGVVDGAGVAPPSDLGQQLAAAHDRPRQEVGEERDVHREVQRLGRLELAAVDVHDVADRHEGEEGDRDGQADLQQRDGAAHPQGVGEVVDVDRDEAVVLEPPEDAEQHADRGHHGDAPGTIVAGRRHPETTGVRNHRRRQEQEAVAPPDPAVEDVAQRDHRQLPRARVGVEEPVHREGDGEEDGEVDGWKEHRGC